jgi:hypothetical protein
MCDSDADKKLAGRKRRGFNLENGDLALRHHVRPSPTCKGFVREYGRYHALATGVKI